ncbi:MAG: hypothetical protein ABW220_07850 [Burkholderiaceae bacterium]
MSRARNLLSLLALSVTLSLTFSVANAQSLREPDDLRLAEHASRTQHRVDVQQARLNALAPLGYSGDAQREYRYASASAWLAFSFDARAQRDNRTARLALAHSTKLIELMEAEDFTSQPPAPGIRIEAAVATERLAAIEAMKHDEKLRCAPAHVARLEVATLQAAHAHRLLGWRHARPYWLAVDELAAQVAPRFKHCKVPR